MRILVGCLGYQLGQRSDDTPDRVARRDDIARHVTPSGPPPVAAEEPDAPTGPVSVGKPPTAPPSEEPAHEAGDEAEKKPNPMLAMMKTALPMLKMTAERDARAEADAIARELNLAPHRAKLLADAFAADAGRKIESFLIPMLEGGEVDPEAIADMKEPDGLISVALERDLNTILNGNEMEDVRGYLQKKKDKEIDEQVENNVKELDLPDLDEDQERRLRELLRGDITDSGADKDPTGPADLRKKLTQEMDTDTVVEKLEEQQAAKREKLAVFLTLAQLERLDKYHAEQKKQAALAADMFGGLFGGKVEVKTSK